jgi:hypothetical protein
MHWYTKAKNSDASRLVRGSRRLWLLCKHPGDFWLVFRIFAWACVLPILKRVVPLKSLTRFLWLPPKTARNTEQEEKIGAAVRWIYLFVFRNNTNCIERSLLLYRFLSRSNADPSLVTGMKRAEGNNWKGHAWILVDGIPFEEPEASIQDFKPLMIFGHGGTMSASALTPADQS